MKHKDILEAVVAVKLSGHIANSISIRKSIGKVHAAYPLCSVQEEVIEYGIFTCITPASMFWDDQRRCEKNFGRLSFLEGNG